MNRPLRIFLSQKEREKERIEIRIGSPSFIVVKSPNLQDQSINRQIYLVCSQKKLWNRTWWWMWNSFCSFIVQITENHTVESFRNSRQRDKRCKRYSTIRRGPFTLGGVRFLHEFPEEESACTRVLRPRSLNQWWFRSKNKSSRFILLLDSYTCISFDFLIRNTRFEMGDRTTK